MSKSKNIFVKSMITLSLGLALTACGDSKTKNIIDEIMNSAPVISSTAVLTANVGTAYTYTLLPSDADGDALTLSTSTLPAWLSFNSTTGILSGTPAQGDAGEQAITLTVSDGMEDITQLFTISVTVPDPVNNAAVITSTGVTAATVGQAYSYMLTATDADSDTLTMSTTVPGALSWLTFDAETGILSGTPASGDVAATEITLTINDGTEDVLQKFTITVVDAAVERTPALVVYEDAENPLWPAWDCCGGTTPSVVSDSDADYDQVTQFNIVGETVVGFNAKEAVGGVAFDTPAGTTLEFDLKVTAMPTAGDTDWKLKLEGDGASEVSLQNDSVEGIAPTLDTWVHYTFNVGDLGLTYVDIIMMFPAWGTGDGAEFSIDNVSFYTQEIDPDPIAEGLITNAGFDNGFENWTEIGTIVEGDNNYFEADVQAAGNPWDVSLNQVITLLPNTTYTFSFKAKASLARTMTAGLGLNYDPWTSVDETVELTTEWATYTYTMTTTFGDDNNRVIFDMGAAVGVVSIDDVSVTVVADGGGEPVIVAGIADIVDYGFVANGGFEDGITGWGEENAMISVEMDDLGTQLVKIIAPEAQSPGIKQSKIGEGVITPGQALTVSFDMKGTAAGDGGIVNALLFTEASSGVSKTDNLMTIPPTADWTNYSFDVTAGADTEWGVSLLLQPACGAVLGCEVTAYFDNVSITTTP